MQYQKNRKPIVGTLFAPAEVMAVPLNNMAVGVRSHLPVGMVALEKFQEHGLSGLVSGVMRFFGVALTSLRHAQLVQQIDRPITQVVREKFPRVQYRYTLPYLSLTLKWAQRRSALKSHYAFINDALRPGFYERVLVGGLEIWSTEIEGQRVSVSVMGLCPISRHREGELTLAFKLNEKVLYKLSFSVVSAQALDAATTGLHVGHVLYVGRIQGVSGAMDDIRHATALLGDIAPQDLLMHALLGMASALGIQAAIGASDETCISRNLIERSGGSFSYRHFWDKYGAQRLADGNVRLDLPLHEKPIGEIAAKHRGRTLRKRETKAGVTRKVEAALRSLMA